MSKYTKEDILRLAKEQNVRFIRLQFTDILGCMKNVAINIISYVTRKGKFRVVV